MATHGPHARTIAFSRDDETGTTFRMPLQALTLTATPVPKDAGPEPLCAMEKQ